MLEQDFEKLLAGYFEDDLEEGELLSLQKAVEENPAFRRRFQREIRLHGLMREEALVYLEGNKGVSEKVVRFGWKKFAAIAAIVLAALIVSQSDWFGTPGGEAVGHCVYVAESSEATLIRQSGEERVLASTVLQPGDIIKTGDGGQASFQISGVGLVTLKSGTEIEIFPEESDASVVIQKGRVLVEAEKRQPGTAPAVFLTPKAEVEVMGTVFGVEVNQASTRVKVHEGLVRFSGHGSEKVVDVEAGQYTENRGEQTVVLSQSDLEPGALLPGQERLLPTDDAYSEHRRIRNDEFIKVEKGRRKAYLKFVVPEGREVLGASLRLTQSVDAGGGGLIVSSGSSNDWDEETLSKENAPEPISELSRRDGWIGLDALVELDVSSFVKVPGTYTLVLELESGGANDIWFGSRESNTPPELIVTRDVD
ncbi:MAG: FecR domain-containing protein [Akkermansiaceae bacterium]